MIIKKVVTSGKASMEKFFVLGSPKNSKCDISRYHRVELSFINR